MKYIYIVGSGRSGSTLVDTLIAKCTRCYSLGEIFRLDDLISEGVKESYNCSCGNPLSSCGFWRGLVNREQVGNETSTISYIHSKVGSDGCVIDSSSNIKRLKKVINIANYRKDLNIELYIIYLTRDARGQIYSASYKGYYRGYLGKIKKEAFLKALLSWYIRNLEIYNFLRFKSNKLNCLHVTYEEIVNSKNSAINQILDFVNIARKSGNNLDERLHLIGGNKDFRDKNRHLPLKEDLTWKKGMKKSHLVLINLIAGRLNSVLINKNCKFCQ